jgi:hypothetical protein
VEEEGVIVNNFCNYNILRFSTDFELFQRFQVSSAKQMPGKSVEAKHIGKLELLAQFYLGSNLNKECSILFYNPCTTIVMTCTS